MKKILSIIVCVVLLVSSVSCNTEKDTDGNGNVSGIISSDGNEQKTENSEKNDTPNTPPQIEEPWVVVRDRTNTYLYEDYIYDNDGKVLEIRTFNTRIFEDQPKCVTKFNYNKQDDGSTIVKVVSSNNDAPLFLGKILIYDASGFCIEKKSYDDCRNIDDVFADENFLFSSYYTYDEEGKLIKNSFGERNNFYSYAYDKNGEMISYEQWADGKCFEFVEFIRNNDGDIIKEKVKAYGEEFENEYSYSYKYDGGVLLEKNMDIDKGTSFCKTIFEYNEKGQMNKFTIDAHRDGYTPARFFKGDGYFVERICFPMNGNEVTFVPLSQALAEQNK